MLNDRSTSYGSVPFSDSDGPHVRREAGTTERLAATRVGIRSPRGVPASHLVYSADATWAHVASSLARLHFLRRLMPASPKDPGQHLRSGHRHRQSRRLRRHIRFLVAPVTNDHELSGLKQRGLILLQKVETSLPGLKPRCWQGGFLLEASTASSGRLHSWLAALPPASTPASPLYGSASRSFPSHMASSLPRPLPPSHRDSRDSLGLPG